MIFQSTETKVVIITVSVTLYCFVVVFMDTMWAVIISLIRYDSEQSLFFLVMKSKKRKKKQTKLLTETIKSQNPAHNTDVLGNFNVNTYLQQRRQI